MTTTVHTRPLPESVASDLVNAVMQGARLVGQWLRMPAPGVPEATAELLRRAAAYEDSQPSYAADLRAAASMARGDAD
jgi:hypothetical protein